MSDQPQRHVFLSYMHEDTQAVDELQRALEAAGMAVWRDVDRLWPGQDWQQKIREAIQRNTMAFVACFSTALSSRETSHQFVELSIAMEEYRKRPPGAEWLFTARFDDVAIPEYDLGSGRMLGSHIQRSDLFGDRGTENLVRLTTALGRLMHPQPTAGADAFAASRAAAGDDRERSDTLKRLLRDPTADIALEDFMGTLAKPIRAALGDAERFPSSVQQDDTEAVYRTWSGHVRDYESLLEPALEPLRLVGMYGSHTHTEAWRQFMRSLTAEVGPAGGMRLFAQLRGYPALLAMHVVAVGCVARSNYAPLLGVAVRPRVRIDHNSTTVPVVSYVNARSICDVGDGVLPSALHYEDTGGDVVDGYFQGQTTKYYTPMSDHIQHVLRDLFIDDFPTQDEYDEAFDRACVLLDALAIDSQDEDLSGFHSAGYGSYLWRHRRSKREADAALLKELSEQEAVWKPLTDGLFGGDEARATEALNKVRETAEYIRPRMH